MAATAACLRLGTWSNGGAEGRRSRRRMCEAVVGWSDDSHDGSEAGTPF